ncbi:hypothetical protein M885DRAFT_507965 [Pelagophyceae sp. CCMP2097]|nr:hypothetical protein M885DRAFT_507965 [Pelagophyceae sp. CCMP2097]
MLLLLLLAASALAPSDALAPSPIGSMRPDAKPIAPAAFSALPLLPDGSALRIEASQKAPALLGAGVGERLWPACNLLCKWLRRQDLQETTVLDLGCGTGAAGLFSAALGAKEVWLTDSFPTTALWDLAESNAAANEHLLRGSVSVERFEWGAPVSKLFDRTRAADGALRDDCRNGPFSGRLLVIGSDVTYSRNAHAALAETLFDALKTHHARVVLAHEERKMPGGEDEALSHFVKAARNAGLAVAVFERDERMGISLLDVKLEDPRQPP